jgi:hypothetical protein
VCFMAVRWGSCGSCMWRKIYWKAYEMSGE